MFITATVSPEEITYAWLGAIVKTEKDGDARYVYGKATDGSIDSDDQIVDPVFAKRALADWYATGANVRQMHSTNLPPAGKGVLLESLADGEYVKTRVVEPVAVKLCDEEVYQGYSVGISRPRIVRDNRARGGRIVDGKIVELSLVDRPANTMAKFAVLKMAGSGLEFVGKVVMLDAPAPAAPVAPRPLRRYQKGTHVTVHARSPYGGEVTAYEGRIVERGRESLAIDQAGYATGGRLHFATDDIVAVFKGAVTVATAGKVSNPDTEVSVADDQTPASVTKAADDAADCDKCDGMGKVDGANCAGCGGSGKATIVKDGGDVAVTEEKVAQTEISDGEETEADTIKHGKTNPAPAEGSPAEEAAETPAEEAAEDEPAEKGVHVVTLDAGAGYEVRKGAKVYGTHPTQGAAHAHKNAILRERKAAKVARKTARKAANAVEALTTKAASAAEDGDTVPWLVRRAHDFTCGAYKTEDIYEVYPSIENGAALTKSLSAALYAEMATEIQKGAKATNTVALEGLGKALRATADLVEAGDSPEVAKGILAAREELHSAFKAANGFTDAKPGGIPKPSESISAGQFHRGYLSAGRIDQHASAHPARIPTTTHPISASDFKRGQLTEGHQRYLSSKVEALHDGLTEWQPDLCLMDSNGSHAFDRQPAGSFYRGPVRDDIPNGAGNSPTALTTSTAGANKSDQIVVPMAQPVVATITPADIEAAVTKALEPHLMKIASLEANVEAMASAPDPNRSANRGVAGEGARTVDKVSRADKASQKATRGKKAEQVDYMQSLARSGVPEQRISAADWLARKGIDPV